LPLIRNFVVLGEKDYLSLVIFHLSVGDFGLRSDNEHRSLSQYDFAVACGSVIL